MATASLMTHCGARLVSRKELESVQTPPATETWFPLSHATVLDRVEGTLQSAGFHVRSQQFALSRGNARFFGTLDLDTPLSSGVSLAVGVRNSIDKCLPIAFCGGSRVFICDNLAFSSEIVVNRKHTRWGELRFNEAVCEAVQSLNQFKITEAARIQKYEHTAIKNEQAESIMLRAYEKDIVSHRLLPRVIREWRSPTFEEFAPRTLWSLENAFTTCLADVSRTNPQRFCALTITLQGLIGESLGEAAVPQLATSA